MSRPIQWEFVFLGILIGLAIVTKCEVQRIGERVDRLTEAAEKQP